MSSRTPTDATVPAYSDAEKGLIDIHAPHPTTTVPASAFSAHTTSYPLDEKKADLTSPTLFPPPLEKKEAPPPAAKPSPKKKKKASKWVLWRLWFNTYRFVVLFVQKSLRDSHTFRRKFFTFVFTINAVGIGLAASGHWPYAVRYSGAMVLGNLFFAILMRNELFGRFLYWFVNTFFAKWTPLWWRLGCTSALQVILISIPLMIVI